jgi:hypothetical protein
MLFGANFKNDAGKPGLPRCFPVYPPIKNTARLPFLGKRAVFLKMDEPNYIRA